MRRERGGGGTLTHVGLLAALTVGALLAVPSLAPVEEAERTPGAGRAGPPAPSDPAALALLRRAARNARARSWTGTQVVTLRGDRPATVEVEVEHSAMAGTRSRVPAAPGAVLQEVYDADATAVPGSSPLATPAGLDAGRWESLLTANYTAGLAGSGAVAGEVTDAVELRRADGSAAARLEVGRASGLVLRRQLLDASGDLLHSTAFTRLAVVPAAAVEQIGSGQLGGGQLASGQLASGQVTDGPVAARAETPVDDGAVAALRAAGWSVQDELVPGLALVDARRDTSAPTAAARDAVLHLTYSDGLSTVSLFEQRGRLDRAGRAGWQWEQRAGAAVLVRPGLPERLAWADSGTVFTLVADVGDDVVDAALAALPRQRAAPGLAHRFTLGLERVGSWLDPTR